MKNFVEKGCKAEVVAGSTIASGDIVVMGATVGIAAGAIANGATGVVDLEGVFALPKAASGAMAQGAKVYVPATSGNVTTTATNNIFVGYVHAAAADGDVLVNVLLAR